MTPAKVLAQMNSRLAKYRFAFVVPRETFAADVILFGECLAIANRLLERAVFEYVTFVPDGVDPRPEIKGEKCKTELGSIGHEFDVIVVFGTDIPSCHSSPELLKWLRHQSRHGVLVGSIANGAHVLAQCGLLESRSVALPVHSMDAFCEIFPHIDIAREIYTIDDRCFSCVGGVTTIDLALRLIADRMGFELASLIADRLAYEMKKHRAQHAESLLEIEMSRVDRPTYVALKLMRENIETPIPISTIAKKSGVSIRQLQRKFLSRFSATPRQYYMKLRLMRARSLLQDTKLSVTEISEATGFGSHATFSKKYRWAYSKRPSDERATNWVQDAPRETEPPFWRSSLVGYRTISPETAGAITGTQQ